MGNSRSVVCSVICVVCIVVGVVVTVFVSCVVFVIVVAWICCSSVSKIVCGTVCLFVVVWLLVDGLVVWSVFCFVLFVGYEFVLLFCSSFSICSCCSLLLFLFSLDIYFGYDDG